MKIAFKTALFITAVFLLSACTSAPEGITPVKNFDLEKYQGKWYEIARLDHSFEQGMEQVTATYSINDDGTVKVLNKGFISLKETKRYSKHVEFTNIIS